MAALTSRQQAALDRIMEQGSVAGIDKGMIQALTRKGALSNDFLTAQQVARAVAVEASQAKSKAAEPVEPGALPDYTRKSWNSLSDLVERIKTDGREEIVSFDGIKIVTDAREFGLAFGELTVTVQEDEA